MKILSTPMTRLILIATAFMLVSGAVSAQSTKKQTLDWIIICYEDGKQFFSKRVKSRPESSNKLVRWFDEQGKPIGFIEKGPTTTCIIAKKVQK